MSRSTVRAAVATYLGAGAVANLNVVHPAKPLHWKPTEARWDGTQQSSASGYVHIERVVETRAALGKKDLQYTVALIFVYRSRHTGPTGGDDRMADFDTLVDAIKAKLRTRDAVTNLPLGGLAAGVYAAAEELLEDEADLPQEKAATSSIWALVRFEVSEMITA